MNKIFKRFFLKLFTQHTIFYFFLSSIFSVCHIGTLFNYKTSIRFIPYDSLNEFRIFYVILLCLMISVELFSIAKLQISPFYSQIQLTIILICSLSVHLLNNLLIIHEKEISLKELLNFDGLIIIFYSIYLIQQLRVKICVIIESYCLICFKWKLFNEEVAYSAIYSLLLILIIVKFLIPKKHFISNSKNITKETIENQKKSEINENLEKKENTNNEIIESHELNENHEINDNIIKTTLTEKNGNLKINENVEKLLIPSIIFKSSENFLKVTTLEEDPKDDKIYSHVILNSIREGIVIFDQNFHMKWHNEYINTLFEEENEVMESKILSIKQDEKFIKIQNKFLKSSYHFTELFKAFQTKIKTLKTSFNDHTESDQTPLLSSGIRTLSKIGVSFTHFKSVKSECVGKFKNKFYLNQNINIENPRKQKNIEIKTLKDFLRAIMGGMETSTNMISSEAFNFNKYNMYGKYIDEENAENMIFFIRFFPHKNEVVVMMKYMPSNDLINAAMNDSLNQNRLFASMCHELRTPLNYITNILEIMQSDLKEKRNELPFHNEYVNNALMSSKLLISSVNDFLDYFSISSDIFNLTSSNFNFKNLMIECYSLFEFLANRKNIEFVLDFDEQITFQIFNDEMRIRQIILNLLNNAFKYACSGSITLKAKKKPKYNLIEISVCDTGSGIPQHALSHLGIFSSSSTSQTTGGFGLCISNHLANHVGPSLNESLNSFEQSQKVYKGLKVKTEIGKGSKFSFLIRFNENLTNHTLNSENTITCPSTLFDCSNFQNFEGNHSLDYKFMSFKSPVKVDEIFQTEKSKKENSCNCKKVLAVDDNEFNLFVLSEKFKKYDYLIDLAHSGDEAIEKISRILSKNENSTTTFCNDCKFYKLILMDIDMPIKNGYETAIILKDMFRKTDLKAPIVAFSAFSLIEYKDKAFEVGMEDYIEKPLNQSKFDYLRTKYLL